jgi:hypothetical protein
VSSRKLTSATRKVALGSKMATSRNCGIGSRAPSLPSPCNGWRNRANLDQQAVPGELIAISDKICF